VRPLHLIVPDLSGALEGGVAQARFLATRNQWLWHSWPSRPHRPSVHRRWTVQVAASVPRPWDQGKRRYVQWAYWISWVTGRNI
jgi:hypothetical protein